MATELTIKNIRTSKYFYFRGVSNYKTNQKQTALTVPLIGTTGVNTFLFRFSGQILKLSFSFALWNDGTTQASDVGIITVAQQIEYLRETIFDAAYNSSWEVYDANGLIFKTGDSFTGVIEDLNIETNKGANTIVNGSMVLKQGAIGSI